MSTLPDSYTQYPKRREGYDHDLYEWSNLHERPPVKWPKGSVAVWLCVSLEWFPIVPGGPFKAPGHMVTPYPDYRHYTARDYGNRVGAWRMLEAFETAGVKASFATNAAIAERYPYLIEALQAGGHEIIAHSTDMNGTIDASLGDKAERALIGDAMARLETATGARPKGWLSIARQQSFHTLDILKAEGLTYCCDWVNDEMPYRFSNGLIDLPLNHELSDRQIVTVQQKSADSWGESIRDAFDWLAREAKEKGGGRMLPIHLTPYIMGLPYRIHALEALLADLSAREEAWFARGEDIVSAWEQQR
ncbi:polysaccharide deacetylase family protein [Erythrobacter sp.]|jgi:peptidoglycan/xylan/chitin deacetylase (PgdA/CDA1 family)|uniref:polysaccharide deacetylase family protein n=1 Tax=Erythrobacter sp. TaxID=1042 RepID=UPI002ECF923B|nr:polysaccharide deacetylase family protein [Erythrobacter sp.]